MMHKDLRNGSAMVEMVIILPILAIILFATIEFGIAMQRWQIINNAAREAVRANVVAACDPNTADAVAEAIVNNYVTVAGLSPGEVDVDPVNLCQTTGTFATVTVTHDFPLAIVGNFLPEVGSSVPLTGAATMRNE